MTSDDEDECAITDSPDDNEARSHDMTKDKNRRTVEEAMVRIFEDTMSFQSNVTSWVNMLQNCGCSEQLTKELTILNKELRTVAEKLSVTIEQSPPYDYDFANRDEVIKEYMKLQYRVDDMLGANHRKRRRVDEEDVQDCVDANR